MAPVTETVSVTLAPTATEEAITSAADAVAETILAQPGCARVRYGRAHEDQHLLRLWIDWTGGVAAHAAFTQSEAYRPMLARLGETKGAVLSAESGSNPVADLCHVAFEPFPPAVLDGGADDGKKKTTAEVLWIYFPDAAAFGPDHMADAADKIQAFVAETKRLAPAGFTGHTAGGWVLEEVDFKGDKARAFVLALGWESVDAHLKFRETGDFQRLVPMLRGLKDLKGMELKHWTCTTRGEGA